MVLLWLCLRNMSSRISGGRRGLLRRNVVRYKAQSTTTTTAANTNISSNRPGVYKALPLVVLGGFTCYIGLRNKIWTREGRRIFLVKTGGILRFIRCVKLRHLLYELLKVIKIIILYFSGVCAWAMALMRVFPEQGLNVFTTKPHFDVQRAYASVRLDGKDSIRENLHKDHCEFE